MARMTVIRARHLFFLAHCEEFMRLTLFKAMP